ncbi:MAG: 8-oxo-dGTP diphosphatase MutT [Legionella sp.]|nr:MAG: 8-oxo-dGTP diphosphatase MutT [Legionella sp.]
MKVAVAIILDAQKRILITQRPYHASHGGRWEFPGGKLEENESAAEALLREVKEEVGLAIQQAQQLGQIKHQYPNKTVELFIFHVSEFSGEAACLEGQLNLKWLSFDELNSLDFPEANQAIFPMIEKILSCEVA